MDSVGLSNKFKGRLGEKVAKAHLQDRGYLILSENWTGRWAEIDLIAYFEKTVIFVEVKTRFSMCFGLPEDSITYSKMCRLKKSAKLFLQQNPKFICDNDCSVRFDVVAVRRDKLVHYKNVFGL